MVLVRSLKNSFLLIIIVISALCSNLTSASASAYFTFEEVVKLHPEQSAVVKNFKTVVDAKGKAIAANVQKTPVRIAFIYPGDQVSDYWKRSVLSFTKRMDEIGLRYEIQNYFSQSGDIRLQEGQLREALANDPDYLVYTLDVNRHKRLVEQLISKRHPKIILQNVTTPLKEWHGKPPFLYVGFDHVTGTRLLAERIESRLDKSEKGSYAVLFYSQGYVSEMRGETFIRLMAKKQWKLKDSYYTDGKREKAKLATLEILSDPKVKLIYACSTDVAFGALDALRETGKLGSVIINGWGGGSDELQAVLEGTLDLTVMRINDDNGVAMAEAIRLDLEGEKSQVPIVFSGDFAVVEKGITEEKLQALRERSFRYSGVK